MCYVSKLMGLPHRLLTFRRHAVASTACGLLLFMLGQLGVPFLAARPCGLVVPHDHVFVGPYRDLDLQRHLAAEAACARGMPDPPDEQAASLSGIGGNIRNVAHTNQAAGSPLAVAHCLTADLPHEIVIEPVHQPFSSLEPVRWFYQLITIQPPHPPPEAGQPRHELYA